MRTYIPQADIPIIIHSSGEEIRQFLSLASPDDFRGEAKSAIKLYRKDPYLFSDKHLVEYGNNIEQAINNPMRIEVRHASQAGAAQVVAKGVWGATTRQEVIKRLREELTKVDKRIEVRLAGSSSFEFNVKGVNKACSIRFLRHTWPDVLAQMNYTPGPFIDSRKTHTIISADGDGTIYDGPKAGQALPTMAQSQARSALIGWLEAGGVFMLNSGNELGRNVFRLKDGLPAHLFGRILVSGNGGADLVCFDAQQNPVWIKGFSELALSNVIAKYTLDIVYIGDDGSEDGNDWAAFEEVGFDRSVLVAKDFKRSYDARLRTGYAGHLVRGTKTYLEIATIKAKNNHRGKPFLSAWAVI
ncbi:MAG: hypothetical protein HY209_07395 [Candidatus Omnitrophica bacterium]|nr:hypothetical protein [Candidatus Omnitrophota bacterium]